MSECQAYGYTALRRTDIDDAADPLPGEYPRQRIGNRGRHPSHCAQESFQPDRVGVEIAEQIATALSLVLRLSGAQSLGQRAPEPVKQCVEHLNDAADVAGLGAVEKARSFGTVGIETGLVSS